MKNVYRVKDSVADRALLSLVEKGFYRTAWRTHMNVQAGKEVDYGINADFVNGEFAREVITPMMLQAGILEKNYDGRLTTGYQDLVIEEPKRIRGNLFKSMELNVKGMCRYAVALDDNDYRRSTAYSFKRGCDTVITEGIEEIRRGFQKILNAPLNDDDSKNVEVEVAILCLKEKK